MADNEDLYPSAARLGRLDKARAPKPPKLDYLQICLQDGRELLYEYRHVGSVMLTKQGDLVIHCTCGNFENITLRGRNLRPLAPLIAHFILAEIREIEHPSFTQLGETVVQEIEIKPIKK
jgi:hypothetical protein